MAAFTLPGARLFFEGQLEAARWAAGFPGAPADEPADADLHAFYLRLLEALRDSTLHGAWELCPVGGWPGDDSCADLVSWGWDGDPRWLVVEPGRRPGPRTPGGAVADVAGRDWHLDDPTTGASFVRGGDDLATALYVELGPWSWHLLHVDPAGPGPLEGAHDRPLPSIAASPAPQTPASTCSTPAPGTHGAHT